MSVSSGVSHYRQISMNEGRKMLGEAERLSDLAPLGGASGKIYR